MRFLNPPSRPRWTAAGTLIVIMALTMLVTGITASAENGNPQKAPVTGLSASTGSGPGEIDVAWDAHPEGALEYRVAWAPSGEGFRGPGNTDWNAFPADTSLTITGLEEGAGHKVKVRARFQSNPKSRWSEVVTATAAQAPQSDPPPPEPEPTPDRGRSHETLPELSIQDGSDHEEYQGRNGVIDFRVVLSEPTSHDVTLTYSTSIEPGDTAEADDFMSVTNRSFTIPGGFEARPIPIDIHHDDRYEGDETFTVTISNPVNATIADATATGTIIDNETEPTLSIADASATEGDDMLFNVRLSGPSDEDVTFHYATSIGADDTSGSGDFIQTSGTGTIPAYALSSTVTVPTHDDGHNTPNSSYEGDETFTVTISNPVGAGISRATAKGTIIDDESIPEVSFLTAAHASQEDAGIINNVVAFDIHPKSEIPLEIALVTTGSATSGDDYAALPQTLTTSRNQSGLGYPLTIIEDSIFEGYETIIIQLVAASDHLRVDPNADTLTITIGDNDPVPRLTASLRWAGTEGGQNDGAEPVAGQEFANVVFELKLSARARHQHKHRLRDHRRLRHSRVRLPGLQRPGHDPRRRPQGLREGAGHRRPGVRERTRRDPHPPAPQPQPQCPGRRERTPGNRTDHRQRGAAPGGGLRARHHREPSAAISVGESWLNGNPVMGRIEQENDQDWYRTQLTRGHCYQIEIRSSYYEDEGLTLTDPYLHGVIRDDGVWLPGTNNDDGGTDLSALHTLRFNRTGAYYIAVGHAWYDTGGIFDLSVIDLGTVTKTCSEIDVDNLTYEPGHFDDG